MSFKSFVRGLQVIFIVNKKIIMKFELKLNFDTYFYSEMRLYR